MYTLVLEASTAAGSVALLRDRSLVGARDVAMGAARDDAMFPAIMALLAETEVAPSMVQTIVCGAGPGSFTSLRIAAAIAKGIAHANGARMVAVSSLLLSVASASSVERSDTEALVHADALRGERYAMLAHADASGAWRADGPVARVPMAAVREMAGSRRVFRVDVDRSREGTEFDDERIVVPHARHIVRIANWWTLDAVDLADWEPSYGRLAEAQVKWESTHQRPLADLVSPPSPIR